MLSETGSCSGGRDAAKAAEPAQLDQKGDDGRPHHEA